MLNHIIRFVKGEEGATAPEYGLMVALIAATIVVVVTSIGTELNRVFGLVQAALATAS